jgi:hypothetical protein
VLLHPPVRIDAAIDAELMSSVPPQTNACPTIGNDAGEMTVALGQVVAHAFADIKRIQATMLKRANTGSIFFIIRTLDKKIKILVPKDNKKIILTKCRFNIKSNRMRINMLRFKA